MGYTIQNKRRHVTASLRIVLDRVYLFCVRQI